MSPLTPEQEIIKQAVLQEVSHLLTDNTPQGISLLKPAQVMRMLNISPRTLYSLRCSGMLPAKMVATCYRYAYKDVLSLLEENSASPIAKTKTK